MNPFDALQFFMPRAASTCTSGMPDMLGWTRKLEMATQHRTQSSHKPPCLRSHCWNDVWKIHHDSPLTAFQHPYRPKIQSKMPHHQYRHLYPPRLTKTKLPS